MCVFLVYFSETIEKGKCRQHAKHVQHKKKMENKQENELTQCIYNLENMLNSQSHDHENIMKQLFEKTRAIK